MSDMLSGFLAISSKPNRPVRLSMYRPDRPTLEPIEIGQAVVLTVRPDVRVVAHTEQRGDRLVFVDEHKYEYEPVGLHGVPMELVAEGCL